MNYLAQIKKIDDAVDELVILIINGVELTCFSNFFPYKIEKNKLYQVKLTTQVFNDYSVKELSEDTAYSIIQIGNSFSHIITGRLNNNRLNAGEIDFEDDMLLSNFGYLQGKIISLKVDRIDVEFI
jgi:hypothetical protein